MTRVLVIAEAANPEWTSVPLVGFLHADALRRAYGAHVVTQVRNREALLRAGWREGVDFTALDTEYVASPIHRMSTFVRDRLRLGFTWTTATEVLAYYAFEHEFWKAFGPRIEAGEFDVVHRVTPLTPTAPSLVASRCKRAKVPFVFGPINGGAPWPEQYAAIRAKEGDSLSRVRFVHRLLPGHASTLADSSALVYGALFVRDALPREHWHKAVYVPENAVDPRRFDRVVDRPFEGPLRIAFVGRLVPYKGADMLLEAAAELARAGCARIDVLGDGPERAALEDQARALGIASAVTFHGFVPHVEVAAKLVESDVLALPSIREFGGGVVPEAMVLGVVPIVVDYAGPTELVTDDTGIRVPLGDRAAVVRGFAAAFDEALASGDALREKGRRARLRVLDHLTWDAKAKQMGAIYEFARGRSPRPDFALLDRPLPS